MSPELKEAMDNLIAEQKIVVFMKGNKQFPQCGFSNTVVQVSSGCLCMMQSPCRMHAESFPCLHFDQDCQSPAHQGRKANPVAVLEYEQVFALILLLPCHSVVKKTSMHTWLPDQHITGLLVLAGR